MTEADALGTLRAHLLQDGALATRIAPIEDRDAFVAAAEEIAIGLGLRLDRASLHAALAPGVSCPAGPPYAAWPGPQWLPVAVADERVEWAHFAGARLVAPFFHDSAHAARRLPFNRFVRTHTPLSSFADRAPATLPVPDGLIFHLSRCGSTLVAQMLKALDDTIVVAEAPPIDAIVQGTRDAQLAIRRLRAMAGALGRDAGGGNRRYVIKLDSWHVLALPLFRSAFPRTPWIFLYRDPLEVLVSQMRQRGLHTVPGQIAAFDDIAGSDVRAEAHVARVLARILAAAIAHHAAGGGLLVNYRDLPAAVGAQLLPHLGVAPSAYERTAMAAVAHRDAKTPQLPFVADSNAKRQAAGNDARAAAASLMPLYAQLETLRRQALQHALEG